MISKQKAMRLANKWHWDDSMGGMVECYGMGVELGSSALELAVKEMEHVEDQWAKVQVVVGSKKPDGKSGIILSREIEHLLERLRYELLTKSFPALHGGRK